MLEVLRTYALVYRLYRRFIVRDFDDLSFFWHSESVKMMHRKEFGPHSIPNGVGLIYRTGLEGDVCESTLADIFFTIFTSFHIKLIYRIQ